GGGKGLPTCQEPRGQQRGREQGLDEKKTFLTVSISIHRGSTSFRRPRSGPSAPAPCGWPSPGPPGTPGPAFPAKRRGKYLSCDRSAPATPAPRPGPR